MPPALVRASRWLQPHHPAVIVAALALAVRITFIWSPMHRFDSDHSIVYLMALNVRDGEFPAFFWGQEYGGSLLPIAAGLLMLVTGPSVEVFASVGALFFVLAGALFYAAFARVLGTTGATTGLAVFLFGGEVTLKVSVQEPGFYGPSLAIAAGVLLTLVTTSGRPSLWRWATLGALCGLAVWTSPMAAGLAAPPAIAFVIARFSPIGFSLAAIVGIGFASPWLVELLSGGQSSRRPVILENLYLAVTSMLPTAVPLGGSGLVQILTVAASIFILGFLLLVGLRYRMGLLLSVFASTVFVHVIIALGSGAPLEASSNRYAVFYLPAVALFFAYITRRSRVGAVVVSATALLVTVSQVGLAWGGSAAGSGRFDSNYAAIAAYLEEEGIDAAYGSYWMAYAMTASLDEQITIASLLPRRYAPYEAAAAAESRTAIVVYADNENDRLLTETPGLPDSTRTQFGGYAVHVFDERVDPYELPLALF